MIDLAQYWFVFYWIRIWMELACIQSIGILLIEQKKPSARKVILSSFAATAILMPLDYLIVPLVPVIALLLCCLSLFALFRISILEILGSVMFGTSVTFLIELMIKLIYLAAGGTGSDELYLDMSTAAVLIVAVVISSFMCNGRMLTQKQQWLADHRNSIRIVSVCAVVPITFAAQELLKESVMFWGNLYGTIIMIALFCVVAIVLVLHYLQIVKKESEIQTISQYGDYLSSITEELHKREHEYKNQLNTIIGIAERDDSEGARQIVDYAEQILSEKREQARVGSIVSDNSIVAAYIYRMETLAAERGIRFEHYVVRPFPEYPISDYDLIELLSNLINNSFEAAAALPEEKRQVTLRMDKDRIEVTNCLHVSDDGSTISAIARPGHSTKGKGRGYGLTNVSDIIKKYGLKMETFVQEDVISVTITC